MLQTILVPVKKYPKLSEAKRLIKSLGYKLSHRNKKPELIANYWHFRQGDKKAGAHYFTTKKRGLLYVHY